MTVPQPLHKGDVEVIDMTDTSFLAATARSSWRAHQAASSPGASMEYDPHYSESMFRNACVRKLSCLPRQTCFPSSKCILSNSLRELWSGGVCVHPASRPSKS